MDLATRNDVMYRNPPTMIGYGILTATVAVLVAVLLSVSQVSRGPHEDAGRADIVIPSNLT